MKKIVLSAIAAIALTVGVYHIALLLGAREPTAAFAAFAVAFAFAAVAATAFAFAAVAATAFAAVVAVAEAAVAEAAAVATTTAFAFATVIAVGVVAVVAEQGRIRFKWVALAYTVEALTVWGALAVGNAGWSAAIALGGLVALLALWYAHGRFGAREALPVTSAVPEHNGA